MDRTISKHMEPPWEPKWQYHLLIFSWLKLKQRWYKRAKPSQKSKGLSLTYCLKIRLYQKWRTATREKPGPYVPVLWFLRRKLISTEEALFYGGSWFLQRRLISTEEAAFYGGSWFLRRRLISTEEADFYGGSWFLRRRLISTEEVNF